jgi:hypothetical protein
MRNGLIVLGLSCAAAQGGVTLWGSAAIPGVASDFSGLSQKVSGIPHNRLGSMGSGIAYSGSGDVYYCINDRGPQDGRVPYACRFQVVRLGLGPPVTAALIGTTLLTDGDGTPLTGFAAESGLVICGEQRTPRRFDAEGIVSVPGALYVCEEYGPRIAKFSMSGELAQVWSAPMGFGVKTPHADPDVERAGAVAGRFPNAGFEGLTVTPGGVLFAVMQGSLIQDSVGGDEPGPGDRDLRVVAFDPGKDAGVAQYTYRLDAAPAKSKRSYGVSEILAVNDTDFLFLERDGGGKAFRRVYRASIAGASAGEGPAPRMVKASTPFIDLLDPSFGLGETMPTKIEGMTFGPDLPDGRHTLVIATDNDLSEEPTWFWVFAFTDADLPGLARR